MTSEFRLEGVFTQDGEIPKEKPVVLSTTRIEYPISSPKYGCTSDCGNEGQGGGVCRFKRNREYS